MRRELLFHFSIKACFPAFWLAALLLTAVAGRADPAQVLHGHVPEVVGRLRALSDLAAQTNLQLAVGLPLRNKPALTNLIEDLYNPGSPRFHQYLTTSQFTENFGPTQEDYQKVMDYLTSHGLKVTGTHPNRIVVDVVGAAADVEKAFHVHLRVYRIRPRQRNFFAPDTEPWVEADVPVLDVMGLDNYIVPHPMDLRRKKIRRIRLARVSRITPSKVPGRTALTSERIFARLTFRG
jgi:subtilase family serine protease